jgi:hypothetical protein
MPGVEKSWRIACSWIGELCETAGKIQAWQTLFAGIDHMIAFFSVTFFSNL